MSNLSDLRFLREFLLSRFHQDSDLDGTDEEIVSTFINSSPEQEVFGVRQDISDLLMRTPDPDKDFQETFKDEIFAEGLGTSPTMWLRWIDGLLSESILSRRQPGSPST